MKKYFKNILSTKNIAFAICFLDTLSFSVLIPLLPHLQEKMHITPSQLTFWVFLHGIIAFLVTPSLWKLADIFGKKNVLLWSIIWNAIWYLLILPYNYTLFLLSRIIGWASTANYWLAQWILSDLAKYEYERKKLFSNLALMSWVGFIAGSLLASSLLWLNQYFPFLVVIIGSFFMALLTRFIKESKKSNETEIVEKKTNFFSSRNFRYFLAVFVLVSISLQLWLTSLPIILNNWYDISSYHSWYFLAWLWWIFALFQWAVFPYITKKFSSKKILYFLIFSSIFLLLLLQFSKQNIFSLIILIWLTHNFITMVQTLLQTHLFELYPKNSGWIWGILTGAWSLVTAICPLAWGYLVEYQLPLFLVCSVFSLLALGVYFLHNRKILN